MLTMNLVMFKGSLVDMGVKVQYQRKTDKDTQSTQGGSCYLETLVPLDSVL